MAIAAVSMSSRGWVSLAESLEFSVRRRLISIFSVSSHASSSVSSLLALILASRVESSVANWSLSRGSTKAATGKGGSLIHPSFQLPFGEAAQTPPWSACSAQVIPDCQSGVAKVSAFSGSSKDGSISLGRASGGERGGKYV